MEDIENLKYADLQKLAKSLGVKANQKMDKLKLALYDAIQVKDNHDSASGNVDDKVTIKLLSLAASFGKLPERVVELTEKSDRSGNLPDELVKSNEEIIIKGRPKNQQRRTIAAAALVSEKSLPANENKAAHITAASASAAAKGSQKTVATAAVGLQTNSQAEPDISKQNSRRHVVNMIDESIDQNVGATVEATSISAAAKGRRNTVAASVDSEMAKTKQKSARTTVNTIDEATYDAIEKFSSANNNDMNRGLSEVTYKIDKPVMEAKPVPTGVLAVEPRPPLRGKRSSEAPAVVLQLSKKRSNGSTAQNDDDEIILQPTKRTKRSGDKLFENTTTATAAPASAATVTATSAVRKSKSPRSSLLEKHRTMITQRRTVHSRVSISNPAAASNQEYKKANTTVSNQENKATVALKTQIPRLHVDLKSKERSAEYWGKIHAKNFDKMDSLDDYMRKKLQRRTDLITPREQQLQQQKTPAAVSGLQAAKLTTGTFVPTVLTTKSLNLNFGQTTNIKMLTSTAEKPREVFNFGSARRSISSLKPRNFVQRPATGNTSVNRKSIGMMSPDGCRDESSRKAKFDLKASLARPITWEVHRGVLKPYEIDEKVQHGCIKAVKVKTREERRLEAAKLRQERRATVKANNRNISSANISCV